MTTADAEWQARHALFSNCFNRTGQAAKPAGRRPAGAGMSDGQDRAPDGGGSVKRAAAVRRKSRGGMSGTAATTVWGYPTEFAIVGESRGRCSHAVQVAKPTPPVAAQRSVRHSVFPVQLDKTLA